MKIFQIVNGFCHWDATPQFPTLKSLEGKFGAECEFVEAPDYVFEGWGHIDGEFLQPEAPEGWLYDESSGTFYEDPTSGKPGGGVSAPRRNVDKQNTSITHDPKGSGLVKA